MKNKFFLILFFLVIFFLFLKPIGSDGDFFHHINTGEFILSNFAFPFNDIFSFTAYNKSWVAHSWLSGIIFYLIYKLFGSIGISILISIAATLTTLLFFVILQKNNINKSLSFISTFIVANLILVRFPPRPEIFIYSLTLSLFLTKKIIPTILIILLWTNLYGASVILGIFIIIFQELFEKNKSIKRILVASLAAFITPYTYKSVFYFWNIRKISPLQGEWANVFEIIFQSPPIYLIEKQFEIIIFFIALLLILFLLVINRKYLFQFKYLSFMSLIILGGLFAFRYAFLFSIISLMVLTIISKFNKNNNLNFKILSFISLIILPINLWITPPNFNLEAQPFNQNVIKFITENNLSGNTFNNQHIGSFLTYHLYPQIKIFTDTRDEVFIDTDVFFDVINTYSNNRDIDNILKKYPIDIIIADFVTGGDIYQKLFNSSDWSVVFIDENILVAVPAKVAQEKNLYSYQGIDPFNFEIAKKGYEKIANEEYKKIYESNPYSFINLSNYSNILLTTGQSELAIKILDKYNLSSKPNDVINNITKNFLLSVAYFQKRDCTKTKNYLNLLEQNSKYKILFQPNFIIPTQKAQIQSLYNLICDNKKSDTLLLPNGVK